jgi:hypothetical protein
MLFIKTDVLDIIIGTILVYIPKYNINEDAVKFKATKIIDISFVLPLFIIKHVCGINAILIIEDPNSPIISI